MKPSPEAAPARLIDATRVGEKIAAPSSHVVYLARVDPTFPRPVRLGGAFNSAKRWVESEIDGWIAARIAARADEHARASERGKVLAARLNELIPPGKQRGGRRKRSDVLTAQPAAEAMTP